MARTDPFESDLLLPAIKSFDATRYAFYCEVKVGWRRIDLLAVDRAADEWIAIELKISDWRKALDQARTNHVLVDKSYVALWHKYVPRALKRQDLFEHYRVGLLSVSEDAVEPVLDFDANVRDGMRTSHQKSVWQRLADANNSRYGYSHGTVPVLSA